MTPPKKTSDDLRTLVVQHLQPGLQALQRDGVEVVILAVERGAPAGGIIGIAGTVRSVLEVYNIITDSLRELAPKTYEDLRRRAKESLS